MDGWHARALDSVAGVLFATDRSGLLIYMNKAAEKLSGWTPDALFGKPISALLTGVKEHANPALSDKMPLESPGTLQTKSGGGIPVTYARTSLEGADGQPDGELIVVNKI
ncbi:MAG: PAS domain-containing protein [Elusimicrobia bacterium]|nr:PAS domain-containing protein [Elusimicrobiota bacterium]